MASGFHLTAFENVVCGGTGVYVDSWDDYHLRKALPPDANDFIISSICAIGCTCKTLTVSLLQYVKIRLGNASNPGACTVRIHYTTF